MMTMWKRFPDTMPEEYVDYLVAFIDIGGDSVVTHGWYRPKQKAWHLCVSGDNLPDAIPNTNMLNRVYAYAEMPVAPSIPKEYNEKIYVTGDYEFNEW